MKTLTKPVLIVVFNAIIYTVGYQIFKDYGTAASQDIQYLGIYVLGGITGICIGNV